MEKIKNFIKIYYEKLRNPVFWVRFFAYAIPFAFLLYVLYWNFLPFGYNKTFTIQVGALGDTDSSKEFYLEPSRDLSGPVVAPDGSTYRELNGIANIIFKPKAVLKNAKITVEVEGNGVSLIPPVIDFDPNSVKWDYSWDFSKSIPADLTGNAFIFDGATYFDGKSKLEFPNSSDKFEDGPFTVYAEWMPVDNASSSQQIVGHYNWELWQNKDSVQFRVGRMNNATGTTAYSIKYPISKDFFNTKHSVLAIYSPSENGYIDLFVDTNFAGRTYFGKDKIWKDYGNKNITLGKSNHGSASYFNGAIYKINIIAKNILPPQSKIGFKTENNDPLDISIISTATSTLKQIKLNATQR